jgi:arachidonate 15-lipoxygenase
MEPFGIAFKRQLHDEHPLHRLFKPHFKGTIFINRQAIKVLIAPGGAVDSSMMSPISQMAPVVNEKIRTISFNDLFLPKNLADRGVLSDKLVYPYRDYALLLWDAISVWAAAFVNEYYADDSAVLQDKELQEFANELVSEPISLKGFGDKAYLDGNTMNVVTTKAYLIKVVTMVLFTTSCQHSALNFAQKLYLSYVPSLPLSMRNPELPTTAGDGATWQEWRSWFPSLKDADNQWFTNQLLGTVKYTSLGEYPGELIKAKPALKKSLQDFQNALKEIGKQIDTRESGERVKYLVLHPNQIPASINI